MHLTYIAVINDLCFGCYLWCFTAEVICRGVVKIFSSKHSISSVLKYSRSPFLEKSWLLLLARETCFLLPVQEYVTASDLSYSVSRFGNNYFE
jgi:hypothetical protein